VIHEATFRKLFDERAVRAAMTRANGRHNLHVLNQALELDKTGSAGTRSELEDRFLAFTSRSGLPEPLVNTRIEDLEVDFHWPDLNLIVEVDGPWPHPPPNQTRRRRTRRTPASRRPHDPPRRRRDRSTQRLAAARDRRQERA
jgi:hypothetical protein